MNVLFLPSVYKKNKSSDQKALEILESKEKEKISKEFLEDFAMKSWWITGENYHTNFGKESLKRFKERITE